LRISWGLVVLTCSILLGLDLVGVVPEPTDRLLESRVQLCETLAAQATVAAERSDVAAIRAALHVVVRRNEEVLSAGLRAPDGRLLVAAGEHRDLWSAELEERPPATHVEVPLFRRGKRWGTIEVRFAEIGTGGFLEVLWGKPVLRLMLLVAGVGFLAYLLYLRRMLRYLDPSAVIPARVQAALDVMAEGVLILDENERIVLANSAFSERVGRSAASLLGAKASELGWRFPNPTEAGHYPWLEAIRSSKDSAEQRLQLPEGPDGLRSFVVKGAPVLDGWGRAKGAIATFDDVTELERKKAELEKANVELEKSQEEVRLQNEELLILARRDPLTGVSNRRAFMETFEAYFQAAHHEGRGLSCLMVDIDHFKRINDGHGHQTGDEVIQRVSEALASEVRSTDAVCRYGGEEFCIMLPEAGIEPAVAVSERLRRRIASPGFARVPVTASIGVASIAFGANSLAELINQADEALYASKQAGRNRVTRWDQRAPAEP
jgi:diguanylate cyclase (GGDEF)-like protein/PAS domain S-box-containing protein